MVHFAPILFDDVSGGFNVVVCTSSLGHFVLSRLLRDM